MFINDIFNFYCYNDNNTLKIFTRNGITDIKVSDIPVGSSISSGTKMIPLKGDNIIKTKDEDIDIAR